MINFDNKLLWMSGSASIFPQLATEQSTLSHKKTTLDTFLLNDRLRKATGLLSCINIAPIPMLQASTSKINGLVKSGSANTCTIHSYF